MEMRYCFLWRTRGQWSRAQRPAGELNKPSAYAEQTEIGTE